MQKLRAAAVATPQKIAFSEYGGEALTYSDLYRQSHAICAEIKEKTRNFSSPIAILCRRTPYSVAATFGVIASGAWYVPIDAELPPERIAKLLEICTPSVAIVDGEVPDVLNEKAHDLPIVDARTSHEPNFADGDVECDAPMFGIFTSGSTGTPKLVVKSYRAMTSFIEVYCRTFAFAENEVFGNQIPFYFDASTKDVFATVYLGASTVIIPAVNFSFPVNLVKILNEERISTIVWVPSALSIVAKFDAFAASLPKYLKNVLFVGEMMPVKYLSIWRSALPNVKFTNLYGSTEVAGNSCYYTVDRDFAPTDILPIGRPFDGTRVFLTDPESGKESDRGEICVAGNGLALGYYGDEAKTRASFATVTSKDAPLGERVYLSGDMGKINEYGELVCVSRRDNQIKHMGHRIELGEIEAAATSLGFVDECCCVYSPSEEKIYLIYSAKEESKALIRRSLAAMLPKYSLPHKYVFLSELPHNRNGKIDRAIIKKTYAPE